MELGAPSGAWGWGAENTKGRVHGPTGSEQARPPVSSPTPPPAAQARTMGACAQTPGYRGQGQAPAGSSPAVPVTGPSPGLPSSSRAAPAPVGSCPGNFNQPQPRTRVLPGLGVGDWGALTTVLLRWLWTVKSGQKRRSVMARSRDSARGRAFSSSSSPCSGYSTQATSAVAGQEEAAPRTWGLEGAWIWAQAGTHGQRDEGRDSRKRKYIPTTPNLLRQKGARAGAGPGPRKKPPH